MLSDKDSIFIHPTAIIDEGCEIGAGTKIWHFTHLMSQCKLGENCSLGQNVFVASHVQIGNGVKIQNNVSLYEGVFIEDDVFLGPSMVFTNIKNPRSFISQKHAYTQTRIAKGASVGANATIICGIHIGQYAFIGAGAVVTKNIRDFELVIGNPAKHVGWVSKRGKRLQFDSNNMAICPESGDKYERTSNGVQWIAHA